MGRKTPPVNEKAVEAKEKKALDKFVKEQRAKKQEEDAMWREAGEGKKTKAQAKREQLEAERQEAKMKKQEAKKAAREEEDALVNKQKGKPAKVTLADIHRGKQDEIHQRKQLVEQKKRESRRVVTEDEYAGVVEQPNANREVDTFSARGLDQAVDAVSKLTVGDGSSTPDRNAEKRMKALYFAYQERELPKIRAEKPGLKLSQYKERIWQAWQKSPENPMKGL